MRTAGSFHSHLVDRPVRRAGRRGRRDHQQQRQPRRHLCLRQQRDWRGPGRQRPEGVPSVPPRSTRRAGLVLNHTGPAGHVGPVGPIGPSDGYTVQGRQDRPGPTSVSLTLPPGSYIATGGCSAYIDQGPGDLAFGFAESDLSDVPLQLLRSGDQLLSRSQTLRSPTMATTERSWALINSEQRLVQQRQHRASGWRDALRNLPEQRRRGLRRPSRGERRSVHRAVHDRNPSRPLARLLRWVVDGQTAAAQGLLQLEPWRGAMRTRAFASS